MTDLRAPVIAGIGPEAGTTTVATALHGLDAGIAVAPADRVDVLVCRSGAASRRRLDEFVEASRAATRTALVLAIVLGDTVAHRSAATCAIPTAGNGSPFAHVTLLPHVAALRDRSIHRSEVATLLARRPEQLDGPLRAYVDALRTLAAAVLAGGGLSARMPASGPAGRKPRLWRGLAPVERPMGAVVRDVHGLDDDALEAGWVWRAAG